MPRRQILSSEEKERLLVVPDDDVLLTRMCFLSENDLALINKHRRPANRLGFAVLLCYLRGPGFPVRVKVVVASVDSCGPCFPLRIQPHFFLPAPVSR
ncbi:DUF4158 domain-containing protein, partial [Serratia ficaria]|uniref:DUF4158 domain-containing protein n=1 Tax=Serratia ficaria TaxID=61651 RepID=UPI0021BA919E